jgi:hypothetical protein
MAKKKIDNYTFRPGISFLGNLYPDEWQSFTDNVPFIKSELTAYLNYRISVDTEVNLYPNAVRLLQNNVAFIQEEATAWIQTQVAGNFSGFVGYTYDVAKCKRDIGYVLDAYLHDLRYGGNEETRIVVGKYWINDEPQVDGDRTPEVKTHEFIRDLITDYIFPRAAYTPIQTSVVRYTIAPSAETTAAARIDTLSAVVTTVIAGGLDVMPAIVYKSATYENYTFNSEKCQRDLGYVLTAYLHDLRYGGNEETLFTIQKYYDNGVLQVDGSGQAEVEGHTFIRNLIINNIMQNEQGVTLYPEAVRLLTLNKAYLQNEIAGWIENEVLDAVKCERDIGYLIDGAKFDIALGTNYNALFLGLAEFNSVDNDFFVIDTINRTKTAIAELANVAASSAAVARNNAFFNEVVDIAEGGRSEADALVLVEPSNATASRIAAKNQLVANKNFLATEVNAWVAAQYPNADHDPVKCERDVKYAIDALCYDMLYGGNSATYDQARFFFYSFDNGATGIDPTHRLQTVAAYVHLKTVIGQVLQGQFVTRTTGNTVTQNLTFPAASPSDTTICQGLVQLTADVVAATNQTQANSILSGFTRTVPSITFATAPLQTAFAAITTNKTAVIDQVVVFKGYTYDEAKCIRDSGYVIDALIYDLEYNGNEESRRIAQKYYIDGVFQVDGSRIPEIAAYTFLQELLTTYIFPRATADSYQQVYPQIKTAPNAETGSYARITELTNIFINFLKTGPAALPAVSVRTVPYQTVEEQVVDTTKSYDPETGEIITTLSNNLINIIQQGVGSLPVKESAGYGLVKFQGAIKLEDILLITNTSKNVVIYNFSTNTAGGQLIAEFDGDDEFVAFKQTTDRVNFLRLHFDTSSMDETDDLQIFVEGAELKVRPYDFGTDAIERHRVAAPQSMLDADFEYGLQPTKWQAIGIARGYPSIYEVPGSDFEVASIITDASFPTNGVGASIITVVTSAPHGLVPGNPITVAGLDTSVSGVSRAEGAFVVVTVPTTSSFTFFSKSRVGVTSGTTLKTTYSQIRKGGFYTGASIGTPTLNLLSNGTSGSFLTEFGTPTGTTRFTVASGSIPAVGSPMSAAIGIGFGSQVTATVGSGGIVTVPTVVGDYTPTLLGLTTLTVQDATGVVNGLGADDQTGFSTFVESVVGNNITFTRPFSGNVIGNTTTYTALSGTNELSIGSSATFNVVGSSAGYISVAVNTGGSDYQVGDVLRVLGTDLGGGTSPANDLLIKVATVSSGSILTADVISGTSIISAGNQTVNGINNTSYTATSPDSTLGSGAVFDITRTGIGFSSAINTAGSGYIIGTEFLVLGSVFTNNTSPANDVTVTVTRTSAAFTGLLQDTTTLSGSSAQFNVTRSGDVYTSLVVAFAGSGYAVNEIVTIYGLQLGGNTPSHDLRIQVDNVGGSGQIIAASIVAGVTANAEAPGSLSLVTTAGTGDDRATVTNVPTVVVPGSGINAEFTLTRIASGYTTIIATSGGTGYIPGNRIRILGSSLGGVDVTNDAVVAITSVNPGGQVTAATVTGTGVAGIDLSLYSSVTVSEFTTGVIASGETLGFGSLATLQVIFQQPHGIPPGGSFIVVVTSDNGSNNHALANGSFTATQIPTRTTITFQARAPGIITGAPITATIYPRPDSFFTHRPFDGGVQLGTGGPQHGVQAIRQSKKYIRYQSGKGVMYTTGALFAPSYDVLSIISTGVEVGSTIEITLGDNDHGLQRGCTIRLEGVTTGGYDGDFVVDEIVSERTFRVIATRRVGSRKPALSFNCQVSTVSWQGAVVRAGVFDDQNGIFWEYDGQFLSAVQRTSTKQLAGTVTITPGSNRITGLNTRFIDQLKAGDTVVLRGMTHVVTYVDSQTTMSVTPDYRGVNTASNAKISLVSEVRVKQQNFNKDTLDGNGPSGYNLDITKMQMIGIQYSWYGAGFIDFMLRGSDGNYVFAHRMRNSNINTEAYMRTGNLPVRYEVSNYGAVTRLMGDISNTSTELMLEDSSAFPSVGTVYIENELISYTGKDDTLNKLTGCTRSAQLELFLSGANRNFTAGVAANHSDRTGVILLSNTTTPLISHWGSAFLTDGLFDSDRGYIFNYASTGIAISTVKTTAFLIRLAPSVSNAVVGDLGDRELLNRAQLLLKGIAITSDTGSTGGIVVEGVLNPQNYPTNPSDVVWSSLAGLAAGGQPSFAQVAPGGSINWAGGASQITANATALNTITANITVPNNAAFNRVAGSSFVYTTQASWNSSGATTGFSIAAADTKFQSGTTIGTVVASPSPVANTRNTLTSSMTTFYRQVNTTGASGNGITATIFFNNVGYTPFPINSRITIFSIQPSGYQGTHIVTGAGNNFVQFNSTAFGGQSVQGTIVTAYAAGQTALNITKESWEAMTNPVTITGFRVTSAFPGGTTVSAVSALQGTAGNQYYSVTMSQGLSNNLPATATVISTSFGGAATTTNTLSFTAASWTALPIDVPQNGTTTNDPTKFANGTTITSVSTLRTFGSTGYYTVTFSNPCIGTIDGDATVTFTTIPYFTLFLSRTTAQAVNANATITLSLSQNTSLTNFVYLTQASWETLVTNNGAGSGSEINDAKYPAGTRVASVTPLRTFGGTNYYTVTFTQTSSAVVVGGNTITFRFGQPPFALPGEQVFSFISLPGSSDNLDLSELKELTNTTLGGRGTFPNGPDVLAINVYKVTGAATTGNLIIRWGEAQA